jgi:hypothetical protein
MKDGPAEIEALYRVNFDGEAPIVENETRPLQRVKKKRSVDVRGIIEQILRSAEQPLSIFDMLDKVAPFRISKEMIENHVKGNVVKGQKRVLPDIRQFVSLDGDGNPPKLLKDWIFPPLGDIP